MGIAKILILATIVIVLIIVAMVALMAFSLYRGVNAEPQPPSPEVAAQGEAVTQKIDGAVSDKSAFYLELSNDELSSLLLWKATEVSSVRDISASINPGVVNISGSLGDTPPVPFSGSVEVLLENGAIKTNLKDVSLAFLPVPGGVREELKPLIDQGMDINRALSEGGAAKIQRLDMRPGRMVIVGVQPDGASVSALAADRFKQAFQAGGAGAAPIPPGGNLLPPGGAGISAPGGAIYLALGDSLAANVGVARPEDGYVSRFHAYLERETGRDLGLLNLGESGESSLSITQGQLPQALEEIRRRRGDGDPATEVAALTLDLGANDLLVHLGSAECQEAPRGEACQARVEAGLENFSKNFPLIVSALSNEIEPGTEFYIMTMYNPFDFGLGIPFEEFSNQIVIRLNEIIAENAANAGAKLADPYEIMGGNAASWTNMLQGDIHPNADGYQALAYSLAQAR